MYNPNTTDYSNRQVDLEIFQTVQKPVNSIRVFPSISESSAKTVSGIEKAVQRYTRLILTNLDSIKFDEKIGSRMLPYLTTGVISSKNALLTQFSIASKNALNAMKADNEEDKFGSIPDDETISKVSVLDILLDRANATASLKLRLETKAGTTYTYITPITSGIK